MSSEQYWKNEISLYSINIIETVFQNLLFCIVKVILLHDESYCFGR